MHTVRVFTNFYFALSYCFKIQFFFRVVLLEHELDREFIVKSVFKQCNLQ
jgi:hypothetical protein